MGRIGVATACVVVLWASGALAQTKAERAQGKAHFRQGQGHFNLREFDQALNEFKEAYRLTTDPTLLFNIGQCQFKLGDLQGALYSYRMYLRNGKDVPNRPEVEERIKDIEQKLANPPPPPVTSPPPTTGATSASPATTTPTEAAVPWKAPSPEAQSAAPAEQRQETEQVATVATEPAAREAAEAPAAVASASVPKEAAVLTPPGGAAPELVRPTGSKRPLAPPKPKHPTIKTTVAQPDEDTPSAKHTLAMTMAGIGILGMGAGTTFLMMALSKNSDANKYCNSNDRCVSQQGVDLRSEAVMRGNIATACFAAGGIGLVVSMGLWLWQPSKASRGVTVGVAPQSITLGGQF